MGVRGKGAAFEPFAPLNTGEASGGAALAEKGVVPWDSPTRTAGDHDGTAGLPLRRVPLPDTRCL
jgi:hypothetical protein